MVRTSNKSTFVLKNKFHLSQSDTMCFEKPLGIFFKNFLISNPRILQRSNRNVKFLEAKDKT